MTLISGHRLSNFHNAIKIRSVCSINSAIYIVTPDVRVTHFRPDTHKQWARIIECLNCPNYLGQN